MTSKSDMHKKLCHQLNDTYIRKNHDYGDAFGESIKEHGAIAGLVRMEDKFNRLKHIIKTDEVLVGDEKLEDTLLDLANYAIMMVIELQSPEEVEPDRWTRPLLADIEKEIEALRIANARLEALVDAQVPDDDWFESIGTE